MTNFKDYSFYYDAFYEDKDYCGEAKQIDDLFKKYGSNINHVMCFGCGTGKHDFELNKLGYSMTGIDMSPEMISIAQKTAADKGIDEKFNVADIRKYEPSQKYDAVISLFHVMSYQTTNEDLIDAFVAARKCLDDGGLFVFDAWYGPGVLTDLPTVREKKVIKQGCEIIRVAKPVMHDKENLVDVNYEIIVMNNGEYHIIEETHRMRYLFVPEIKMMLNHAGFELVENVDCKNLKPTSYASWTSYFIARAI